MATKYMMTIRIEMAQNSGKKDAVRDAIVSALTDAKNAANIVGADWHIEEVPITEGGTI